MHFDGRWHAPSHTDAGTLSLQTTFFDAHGRPILKNSFFLGGGVVQNSFPLISGSIPLSTNDKLIPLCIVFPFIEKHCQFCYAGIDETVSPAAEVHSKKAGTTHIDKRGYPFGATD